ncbi:hypothetical protein SeMB42_g01690 [Synchytrium endobioticum]|uniref:General stress protein FMN-binding split barrel domain-containing protein n=1 Tax=Synchytrium endobioticum TaxID=286115 RepID=A0A507D2C8_9FUNG|nr:hypothetical protein SeLEV6574_g03758 [Synchytrium endobioticum]TPX52029.1 hypothetical protein SeMB42_g01690 [Synchytrium endobioticum]
MESKTTRPVNFGSSGTPAVSSKEEINPEKGDSAKQILKDDATPLHQKLEDVYDLINSIKHAMLTTRSGNHMTGRAMSIREVRPGCDLVFITNNRSGKMKDLLEDPHVCCTFFREKTKEWVSISGTARVENDQSLLMMYWDSSVESWFQNLGNEYDGGPMDPRMSLIMVTADSVHYQFQDKSTPRVVLEKLKATVSGETPNVASIRELNSEELEVGRKMAIQKTIPGTTISRLRHDKQEE